MEIKEMTMPEIEERAAAIKAEMETADEARLSELNDEVDALNAQAEELRTKAATAAEERSKVAAGEGVITSESVTEESKVEEKRMFGLDSAEYRDAFYAVLGDYATKEQRDIVVDTSAPGNGDAIAIPKTLDVKIWDNIHTAHPILADVATVRSGMALEVTRHTAIAARTSKKLDSAANAGQEENTFVKVVLYGYDYEKYVQLTYAEAKMSAGAMEDYLAQEIAAELGEALAKDVFAQIETDATIAQKVADSSDMFADIKSALALAVQGGQKVIYAPATAYYEIVGAIKSGSPFNIAATLGCQVKLDTAAAHVTVLDPAMFLLNEVQSIMIESDKDVKNHKVIVSGYLRAQGTLRNTKAAAYIA